MTETLSDWLEADDNMPSAGPDTIADVASVRDLLVAAARQGEAVSYSELLGLLGHRFTRPKMRALCKTLDAIDHAGATIGEPALAGLVVRESDRLPGQGWWTGAVARGHAGPWTGAEAARYVRDVQERAFVYWRRRAAGVGRLAAGHPARGTAEPA